MFVLGFLIVCAFAVLLGVRDSASGKPRSRGSSQQRCNAPLRSTSPCDKSRTVSSATSAANVLLSATKKAQAGSLFPSLSSVANVVETESPGGLIGMRIGTGQGRFWDGFLNLNGAESVNLHGVQNR